MFSELFQSLKDGGLKNGLIKGDPGSLDGVIESYADSLYGYALSLTRSVADAEDAVQSVMLRLVRNRDLLAKVNNLKAYLFKAIRNECLNLLKQRNNVAGESGILELSDPDSDQSSKVIMEDLLSRLPSEQREVIVLKFYLGFGFREIGEILGVPINTAASRHRYGFLRLKELMEVKKSEKQA